MWWIGGSDWAQEGHWVWNGGAESGGEPFTVIDSFKTMIKLVGKWGIIKKSNRTHNQQIKYKSLGLYCGILTLSKGYVKFDF